MTIQRKNLPWRSLNDSCITVLLQLHLLKECCGCWATVCARFWLLLKAVTSESFWLIMHFLIKFSGMSRPEMQSRCSLLVWLLSDCKLNFFCLRMSTLSERWMTTGIANMTVLADRFLEKIRSMNCECTIWNSAFTWSCSLWEWPQS